MRVLYPLAGLLLAGLAYGHPMGNLSINHYARLEPGSKGVDVLYVLDLAEIPTFELTQTWNTPQGTARAALDRKAAGQAREWTANLIFTQDGKRLTPQVQSTDLTIVDGAGNLPVFRIAARLHVPAQSGRMEYRDRNFLTRAGWREVVVRAGDGATVQRSSNGAQDISQALTSYPQDPTKAPPQDTGAWVEWTVGAPVVISRAAKPAAVATASPTPAAAFAPDPVVPETPAPLAAAQGSRPPEAESMGVVKRSDAISRILRMKEIPWTLMAALIGLAFWFGALHALEPGHGKTMVAAYLVGERGTARHAVLLGGMVTFTHTISVFALGIATMFLSRYIMPDRISKVLGIVSGLSIVWIGGLLFFRRTLALGRQMEHDHDHAHHHDHSHDHSHAHDHHHHDHTHTHDGHTHSHVPQGGISMGSLIALGASGGLVPCPSALILLLSAISIGRPGLGLILLLSFSVGLAIVLSCTGLLVLYAKNLLPEGKRRDSAVFRYMPVFSAAAITIVGVLMTSVSLGWIPAIRFIG